MHGERWNWHVGACMVAAVRCNLCLQLVLRYHITQHLAKHFEVRKRGVNHETHMQHGKQNDFQQQATAGTISRKWDRGTGCSDSSMEPGHVYIPENKSNVALGPADSAKDRRERSCGTRAKHNTLCDGKIKHT